MRTRGIVSLLPTVLLCLPSLVGGMALAINLLLQRKIEQWGQVSSSAIAMAAFLGGPLVALAAIVSGLMAFSRTLSYGVKCAQWTIVGLATIVTLSLNFHFGM
jgi:ABC-type arginine/histidine transport system permease subunit